MKKVTIVLSIFLMSAAWASAQDVVKENANGPSPLPAMNLGLNPADIGNVILGGGPDAYGYRWKDSNDPGGPLFNWIDISLIGTEITPWPHGTVDDGWTDLISIGTTFNFYGTDYLSVAISTNGWVSFVSQTNSYLSNASMPNSALPNALLAVNWDDQDGGTVGHCYYYYDSPENRFIVSWVGWPYYPDPTNPHSFEVILNANDSTIVYQYGSGTFQPSTATIGIEDASGTTGLLVSYNTAYASNNKAVKFYRLILAHDVGAAAIISPGSPTYKDSTYSVSSRVHNGGANTEADVPVYFTIKDTTGATVYSGTHTIPSIPASTDSVITFANWTPAEGKTHYLTSYTNLAGDLDRTNDTTRATTYTYAYHGSGGPVGYWSYADDNSGGQPFNWVDITGIGDSIHFSSLDDANSGMIDMGMDFSLFGGTYSRIAICTNGWLSFTDSTSTAYSNTIIPSSGAPNTLVALLWDDLHMRTGHVYHYYDSDHNQFIVQYDSLEFLGATGSKLGIEVIFNGDDNSFVMQYGYFLTGCQTDVTIGIENQGGTLGLAYDNNGEVLQTPIPDLAITFTYAPPNNDVGVSAILSPGATTIQGFSIAVSSRVHNFGTTPQINIPVHFEIYDSSNALVYNQTRNLVSIGPGVDSTITFSNWTPGEPNSHRLVSYTILGNDFSHGNDTTRATTITYPHRGNGGPVAYWYYADNVNGGGPAFNWIDITTVGDSIHFPSVDDANSGMIDMGISFAFFGTTYSRIAASTNGWLSFTDSISSALTNTIIPSTGLPNAIVALLWDDLHLGAGHVYKYYNPATNQFIVEYDHVEFYPSGGPDCIQMEVIFDGNNNSIKMQYNAFCTSSDTDISIGIENQAGTTGLAYNNNEELGQTPLPGMAVTFTYNPAAIDVGTTAILSPGTTTLMGFASPVTSRVHNFGSATQINVPVHFEIYDSVSAMVYNQTRNISTIGPNVDSIVTFPDWAPAEPNSHALVSYTALGGDNAFSNDTSRSTTITYEHRGADGPVADWSYADNVNGGGPPFNWIDITAVGDSIHFSSLDDSNSGLIDMGMTFNFFGIIYSRMAISTNGWLSFTDSISSALTNATIPASTLPNALVALLWDDLHLGTGHVYKYHNATTNQFIVEYDHVEFFPSGGPDCIQMEVIFDGNANSIKMQYNAFCTGSQTDISIGIENQDGMVGLAYDNSGEFGQTPVAGVAVTFTYSPPAHDVRPATVISPTFIVYYGQTYSIVADISNTGANTESFNVRASDNHGYSNVQAVANLPAFQSTQVVFPIWAINQQCAPYVLTIVSQLAGDMVPSNDTLVVNYYASSPGNTGFQYDDGFADNAWRFFSPSNIIANRFDLAGSATISTIAFKFTNQDDFPSWPDSLQDSVAVFIFTDSDHDGFPDFDPVYADTLMPAATGWTFWPVGCQATVAASCESFWAGWSIIDSLKPEGMVTDAVTNYPDQKWGRIDGVWGLYNPYAGDNMIRAYANADPLSAPNATFGTDPISGQAPVGQMVIVNNTLDNTGTACDLVYTVRVIQDVGVRRSNIRDAGALIPPVDLSQTACAIAKPPDEVKSSGSLIKTVTTFTKKGTITKPVYPPVTLGFGGPDLYGYLWKDSGEPDGPAFTWVDISGVGTPVVWENCSSTFGCQDEGVSTVIPLNMNFNFYGTTYSEVYVSSNGWVSFLPQTSWYTSNYGIPTSSDPDALLSVLWDDLDGNGGNPADTGICRYYYNAAENRFIISWDGWAFYSENTQDFSIQVILDGDDNSIVMQYSGVFVQTDYTVGIESTDGTDGLQVAYNAVYVHDALAVKFTAPILWLSTDLGPGLLSPTDPPWQFHITMDATDLTQGIYNGAIILESNDPDQPTKYLNVTFTAGGGAGCHYAVGDVNNSHIFNGIDVTYSVGYFKGGPVPPYSCECTPGNVWYVAGDVNGSCVFNGIDVTYMVTYFKGGPSVIPCPACPPMPAIGAPGQQEAPAVEPVLRPRQGIKQQGSQQ